MIRSLVWLVGALLLGGIVHIVTVLGLPHYAVADPWHEIAALGPEETFATLPSPRPGVKTLPGLDPAMVHAVCRFGLDHGPVRIRADVADAYWAMALYDRRGLWVWGVDNRAAEQKPLDILVADNVQVAQLRETLPEDLEDVVVVDWPSESGFALYKILVPTASQRAEIEAILAGAKCSVTAIQ